MSKTPPASPPLEDRGFTLIEVLLAIGILSVMVTLSYSSIESILRSKKAIENDQEIERLELVLMRRLTREFQLAYPNLPRLPPADNLKQRFSSRENLLGKQGTMPNGQPGDSVTFVAISAGQQFLEDRRSNSGLVQITYSLREDPERAPQEEYPVYSLIREEVPYKRPYEQAYAEALRFPLLDFAEGLQIEYFDLREGVWTREWGDEERRDLPALLRFTLSVRSPNGKPARIRATVPMRWVRGRRR
ncbi:prepilin-type N-terminal cleavage/methylation domain-containing protein [bacterium]|nr:prepilin-type N-terminal cleavage/methylation domain-containing protein [bacterium]